MNVFFRKLRMCPLYLHRVQVHLYWAAMLCCYSSPEQTAREHIPCFMFSQLAAWTWKEAPVWQQRKRKKRNQWLMVLAKKFETPNFWKWRIKLIIQHGKQRSVNVSTWKYAMGTWQPSYVQIRAWEGRGKGVLVKRKTGRMDMYVKPNLSAVKLFFFFDHWWCCWA